MNRLHYDCGKGAALKAFHESRAFVRGVMGPVGSGKSSAMCVEIFTKACGQRPDSQGTRRSRFAVIRNTYPELQSTTIKTWLDWIPGSVCEVTGSGPFTARIDTLCGDGTRVDSEIIFLALDRPKDVKKLLSLELTGAWVNEAREVRREIIDALTARVGRFPPRRGGGCSWSGIIMDTNPPDDEHWWYELAEEKHTDGWEFFRQPPALLLDGSKYVPNPEAENVKNLPNGHLYWMRQLAGKNRQWIDVYIMGKYGVLFSGRRVYPEYDDQRHLSGEQLSPVPDSPLILGWDFGLTPACVLTQVSQRGGLHVIEEFVSRDMGIRQFAREIVRPRLKSHYAGFEIRGYADPAGSARSQTDERTCMDELAAAGLHAKAARTNSFTARREAVAGFLNRFRDGSPGLLLSSSCKTLRKGFISGYRYERIQVAGEERYKDRPVKDHFSHVHDALQYAALAAEEPSRRPAPRRRSAAIVYGHPECGY
jgi:hypothetical protein